MKTYRTIPLLLISVALLCLHCSKQETPANPQTNVSRSSGEVKTTTDASFAQDVLKVKGVVLVDFWASYCRPCMEQAPIIDELAKEFAGRVSFCKVDVEKYRRQASKHGVNGIPAMLIFKNGKLEKALSGFHPKSELEKALKQVL